MPISFVYWGNSVYSHDRPQGYLFGKPDLRVPEIPRPDKEFREAGAGIRFPTPGFRAERSLPDIPGGSGDRDGVPGA